MTGNRVAHPLLISLANFKLKYRMKSTNRCFLLLAQLPIPRFIEKNKEIRGALESRFYHHCVAIVIEPLKQAARVGIMMSDPAGQLRYCYTPLASCIVDTPESVLIACVAGKTSSVTMAMYKQFGDAFQHEPRTASTTLAQLKQVAAVVKDTNDIQAYVAEAKSKFRLNGVHEPFWKDWPMAEPSAFLTPEPLHHWHKMFWDHDVKWCIRAVGADELDFRFQLLLPHPGFRRFPEGISKLKQVTGREHRVIQQYIVAMIIGAVSTEFLLAIRHLMDFRYRAQALVIDEHGLQKIQSSLDGFHRYKQAVLDAGARVGKKNRPIENWHIPKLEFLQSVVSNIRANGVAQQFTADVTEHYHITEIKIPARSTNNQNYEPQICRHLDRFEKCRLFLLYILLRETEKAMEMLATLADEEEGCDADDDEEEATVEDVLAHTSSSQPLRTFKDYFEEARLLEAGWKLNAPLPYRTFVTPLSCSAIHLSRDPTFKQMTVDDAAALFQIPDLRPAIADYLERRKLRRGALAIGDRRTSKPGCSLPFEKISVWSSVRVQSRGFHDRDEILKPLTINAAPPSDDWPKGRSDAVFLNVDQDLAWPQSGIKGTTPVG